jgi:hypothetical protein
MFVFYFQFNEWIKSDYYTTKQVLVLHCIETCDVLPIISLNVHYLHTVMRSMQARSIQQHRVRDFVYAGTTLKWDLRTVSSVVPTYKISFII